MSDVVLETMAGTEIGVASTKAFTAQVSLLYILALEIARRRGRISMDRYYREVNSLPSSVEILEKSLAEDVVEKIKELAGTISKTNHMLYIGRNVLFPMALEGALKIREISYIPAQGLASGELKHGTIALVDSNTFVLALNSSELLYDKNLSSIEEVLARGGKIIVVGDRVEKINNIFGFIKTPAAKNKFEVLLSTIVPLQLLAYYTGILRGVDVDQPRNLAKSVTVE
jgi:glucosamine--fructose-6-phosphate aminotransferase (isomerizing)